jgi:pantoate--beta-alanine ligase
MQICRTVTDIRTAVAQYRRDGATVGQDTTMGALHAGHKQLVAEAKGTHDRESATIFVNPTQFGNPADLESYPRTEAADLAMLEAAGVAAVFIPQVSEVYPEGDDTIVETTRLANMLHGLVRPGHFRGVATVVCKLFNIIQADAAYFGEKDYQQLQVIRRMVRDLHIPIRIFGVATVREADGLAMSSRNVRLTPEDRAAAVCLSRALDAAEKAVRAGASVAEIEKAMHAVISGEPRGRLVAIDIVEAETLAAIEGIPQSDIAIMLSVAFGPEDNPVLLIDQREIRK